MLRRIAKLDDITRPNLLLSRNSLVGQWLLVAEQAPQTNPALPGNERSAGQDEKLGELAPGKIVIFRNVDRKVLAPARLLSQRSAVGELRIRFIRRKVHVESYILTI